MKNQNILNIRKTKNFLAAFITAPNWNVRIEMLCFLASSKSQLEQYREIWVNLEHDDPNVMYVRNCKINLIDKDYWW